MNVCRSKNVRLVLVATTVLAAMWSAGGSAFAEDPPQPAGIKDLLQRRLVAMTEIRDLILQAYNHAETTYDQVLNATVAWHQARLDLCETKEERIGVHNELVRLAEQLQKVAERLYAAKEATRIDVLKAKAQVLDAQIALERAKASK